MMRIRIAPSSDEMNPAGCSGFLLLKLCSKTNVPIKKATNEPPIPIRIVVKHPPRSRPGTAGAARRTGPAAPVGGRGADGARDLHPFVEHRFGEGRPLGVELGSHRGQDRNLRLDRGGEGLGQSAALLRFEFAELAQHHEVAAGGLRPRYWDP